MGEELLFRVWDSKNKRYRNDLTLRLDGYLVDEKGEVEDFSGELYCMFCQVQFATTLRDKNNKQIFQNDVVKDGGDRLLLIKWDNNHAAFVLEHKKWAFRYYFREAVRDGIDVEIVGNLNENPELLKEGM